MKNLNIESYDEKICFSFYVFVRYNLEFIKELFHFHFQSQNENFRHFFLWLFYNIVVEFLIQNEGKHHKLWISQYRGNQATTEYRTHKKDAFSSHSEWNLTFFNSKLFMYDFIRCQVEKLYTKKSLDSLESFCIANVRVSFDEIKMLFFFEYAWEISHTHIHLKFLYLNNVLFICDESEHTNKESSESSFVGSSCLLLVEFSEREEILKSYHKYCKLMQIWTICHQWMRNDEIHRCFHHSWCVIHDNCTWEKRLVAIDSRKCE